MECLGVAVRRAALDAAQPHHGQEGVACEPVAPGLGREGRQQHVGLAGRLSRGQRDVHVRLAESAVPLGRLVLEHHLVPERVPDHLVHDTVVLVPVLALVAEDHVGHRTPPERLEPVLDARVQRREATVRESAVQHLAAAPCLDDAPHGPLGLAPALRRAAQQCVVDDQRTPVRLQREQRAGAADLDVVAVRAHAQHAQGATGTGVELQSQHARLSRGCGRGDAPRPSTDSRPAPPCGRRRSCP